MIRQSQVQQSACSHYRSPCQRDASPVRCLGTHDDRLAIAAAADASHCDDPARSEKRQLAMTSTTASKMVNAANESVSAAKSSDRSVESARKPKKSVRWSTITIHEFGVGLGGSAVSNKGGPSIGLAETPEFTWTTKVGEMAECCEGVHRFSPNQRIRLLQAAGVPENMITRHAREANIILGSRRRSSTSLDEAELEELELESEDESKDHQPRKRSADQALLERPCSVYMRRPRMIPANYV